MKNNLAVIIVDMQPAYVKNIFMLKRRKIIKNIKQVLKYSVEQELPIMIFEDKDQLKEGETLNSLKSIAEKSKNYIPIIPKKYADGFKNTSAKRELDYRGIDNLFLTGITKSVCAFKTAKGGFSKGFGIITSKDVIADPFIFNILRLLGNDAIKKADNWYKNNAICLSNWKDIKKYHFPIKQYNSKPNQ